MKRGGMPGRPPLGNDARTKFRSVRLSEAELKAIDDLQISFADLVRKAIAKAVADKESIKLPRAS